MEWTKYFLYYLQTGFSKSSLQFHIFFSFFEGVVGQRGARQEVFFQTCECNIQQPSSKVPAAPAKKKDKQALFMSAMSSWKCHSFVTMEQSMPGVCSFKRSLNSNKRKIFTSGRGRRQGVGVEEAKFRWQVIAVAICLAVCLIIVLPVLALIDQLKKESQELKQQFYY